jgi:hypothetical protein
LAVAKENTNSTKEIALLRKKLAEESKKAVRYAEVNLRFLIIA